jgi:cell division protein FtsL
MAFNRGTEAYDLSIFEPRPAKVVSLKANKKFQKEQQRRRAIQSFLNTVATICVAALAVIVIGMMIVSRIQMTELDDHINDLQKQLTVLQSEKIRLTDELASKTSIKSVEEYAYDVLGMQKIESSQIQYIESENSDKAVVAEDKKINFLEEVGSAIVNFFTQLAYLVE